MSQSAISDLCKLLPNNSCIQLLVKSYFNKIHWFMLLFHQREFTITLEALYPYRESDLSPIPQQHDILNIGYVSVLLAVCALSLRYTSKEDQERLAQYGLDAQELREQILTTLRLRFLDIIALGSLEAVQFCVLLGSYYLYHGEPELAWPICGSALRLAQALKLHYSSAAGESNLSQQEVEKRKRCWWAVHEIETSCSMVYGFPLSIADADCDAEPLDPYDQWSIAADGQTHGSDRPNLLMYKCCMSKLSTIAKSALEDLYGSRQQQSKLTSEPAHRGNLTQFQLTVQKVDSLSLRLEQWFASLPLKLKLDDESALPAVPVDGSNRHGPTTTLSFDEKLFQLQALALKLAYKNTVILIHRPLLSSKIKPSSNIRGTSSQPDVLSKSTQACLAAAIQISLAGQIPIFKQASSTYALNFICLHLLTAGVILCIVANANPLSKESFEAKLGIRRLLGMQSSLKSDSIIAEQGLKILKRLLSLVMKKETDHMLGVEAKADQAEVGKRGDSDTQNLNRNLSVPDINHDEQLNPSNFPSQSKGGISTNLPAASADENKSQPFRDVSMTQLMMEIDQGI